MRAGARVGVVETVEVDGDLGSHALEAIQLELRRLAERCGLAVTEIRIETIRRRSSGERL